MYLLNIKKLKSNIQAGQFSEADKFKYLFVYLFVETLLYEYISTFARAEPETWDYFSILGSVLLMAGGTYATYLANGGAVGRDFVARFFAVNLVVTCRFMLFSLPLYLGWIYYAIQSDESYLDDPVMDLVVMLLWGVLLYYRIYRHMADLKSAPVAEATNG